MRIKHICEFPDVDKYVYFDTVNQCWFLEWGKPYLGPRLTHCLQCGKYLTPLQIMEEEAEP